MRCLKRLRRRAANRLDHIGDCVEFTLLMSLCHTCAR